jgi:cytochrome c-type biogenesis protein CcmE
VTKRLMMYALNRETEYYDMPQVRKIVHEAAATNYSFAAIVKGVVDSDSFRRQGADTPAKVPTQIAANKIASNDATSKKQ